MRENLSKQIQILILIAIGILLVGGCAKKKISYPSETRKVLGTSVTISVLDATKSAQDYAPVFNDAFKLMADWEKKVLSHGPENMVYAISSGSGEQSITSEPQVFDLIMKALKLYDTGGKTFDIRYGPMLDAWGFDSKPHVPSQEALDTLKGYVTDGGMFVAGNSILLAKQGMRFDVRAFAEGYIFDLVAASLGEKGISNAVIHSPHTWRMIGTPPDKKGFEVTLGNPLRPDSAWATVWAPAGGLSLVSVGQDRFESGGKYYHSILDPRNGMPATKCYAAVVQASDAAMAQGLAYSVFVSGNTESLPSTGKTEVKGSVIVTEKGNSLQPVPQGSLQSFKLNR
jgi:FAD:protein FMN transferase